MRANQVRQLRQQYGWTQAELAKRAGVSRQLVGAVEAGRNLPRVDAALALANALGVDTATLFQPHQPAEDVLTGGPPTDGSLLRACLVGERMVTAAARAEMAGWDVADAEIENGRLHPFAPLRPGVALAGCEPGLELLERWLREAGMGALAVSCSSTAALVAMAAGRLHGAVVHAPERNLPAPPDGLPVTRFGMCRWRVGLAAPTEARPGWPDAALAGRTRVIQREPGAGVQAAFARAAGQDVEGPLVGGHLEAARLALASGLPAVTIEPAALAVGAAFHPLETHAAELWVGNQWLGEPAVAAALNELAGQRFQRRMAAVGGYDLAGCGVAA